MTTSYSRVQDILREAVKNAPSNGPHSAFWELPEKDFIAFQFRRCPIIVKGDGPGSNLITILKGPLENCNGSGRNYRRMPAGLPAVSPANIQIISAWIDSLEPDNDPA